jgi:excisionase family DNA binding protein
MKQGHKLEEVVAAGWAPSVLFLQRRLRRKEIPGSKVGREWRMSDDDLNAYLESLRNKPSEADVDVPRLGLTAASMRRRSA